MSFIRNVNKEEYVTSIFPRLLISERNQDHLPLSFRGFREPVGDPLDEPAEGDGRGPLPRTDVETLSNTSSEPEMGELPEFNMEALSNTTAELKSGELPDAEESSPSSDAGDVELRDHNEKPILPTFDEEKQINTDWIPNLIGKVDGRPRYYHLSIKLAKLFDSSIHGLGFPGQHKLRRLLTVKIVGKGSRQGSILPIRDFVDQLSAEFVRPKHRLFIRSSTGARRTDCFYAIDPLSASVPGHLEHFKVIGRFLAIAVINRAPVTINFVANIWILLVGSTGGPIIPTTSNKRYRADEDDSNQVAGGFNSPSKRRRGQKAALVDYENDSERTMHGDPSSSVVANHVQSQGRAMRQGFLDIIPYEHWRDFSPEELEMLVCGSPGLGAKAQFREEA